MTGAPPRCPDSPPALPDELVEEILVRLPADEPACLLRASIISKAWGRPISSRAFRRRLHEFHRTPPVLGFLHNWYQEPIPRFIPTTASSFSLAAPDCQTWQALDCRHGRALFLSKDQGGVRELLVWEPITGAQRRVPVPSLFEAVSKLRNLMFGKEMYPGAAVLCAAGGCDHRDCHGSPFKLVFVFTNLCLIDTCAEGREFQIWAFVFSSEAGIWSYVSMQSEFSMEFPFCSSVLVGRSLLYFESDGEVILQYDLATHSMTVLLHPPGYRSGWEGRFNIMLTEDGGLGVAEYSNLNIKLWTREASGGTDAQWVLSRVITLVDLLPIGALVDADRRVQVVGFAEGTNTIFLNTIAGIFTVDLQSEKARKVCDRRGISNLVPVVSFYTPVPRGEHQEPPSSGPSEEAGGDEGGEKEKAIDQPQRLFNKGSNAIKEGGTLKTRIPSLKEFALACGITEYGCSLIQNAQEADDPLDDVPKSVPNEGSVTGAANKDDSRNSKTSDSDVEHSAAPSRKGDSEEVLS
ncbi:unnamed protein product [Alopecurus aequalis]